MPAFLRAYVCASPSSAVLKGPYPVGCECHSAKGVYVAREIDRALREDHVWPITLHEIEVPPHQVLEEEDEYLKVRSFFVVRDLPLSDAFGPRADDIVALFGGLRRWPWLAPRAIPDPARVAGLIASHSAALAAYAPVDALPARIVTTWEDARSADNDVIHRGRVPPPCDPAMGAALDAVHVSPASEARAYALWKAQRLPFHLAFQAMWEAAWEAGAAALLATAARTGTADTRTRVKAIDRIRAKLDASRDRSRRAAWKAILETREGDPGSDQPANGPTVKWLSAQTDAELVPVWTAAWNFAGAAALAVARAARHMVALPDEPNPWLPLVELYRMGAWPIDEVAGAYVLFSRAPTS